MKSAVSRRTKKNDKKKGNNNSLYVGNAHTLNARHMWVFVGEKLNKASLAPHNDFPGWFGTLNFHQTLNEINF